MRLFIYRVVRALAGSICLHFLMEFSYVRLVAVELLEAELLAVELLAVFLVP